MNPRKANWLILGFVVALGWLCWLLVEAIDWCAAHLWWVGIVLMSVVAAYVLGCTPNLKREMGVHVTSETCTWHPEGTTQEAWSFPCGSLSGTGWCHGAGLWERREDRCEIKMCPEIDAATKASLRAHELSHCTCQRIGRDSANGSECVVEWEAWWKEHP